MQKELEGYKCDSGIKVVKECIRLLFNMILFCSTNMLTKTYQSLLGQVETVFFQAHQTSQSHVPQRSSSTLLSSTLSTKQWLLCHAKMQSKFVLTKGPIRNYSKLLRGGGGASCLDKWGEMISVCVQGSSLNPY